MRRRRLNGLEGVARREFVAVADILKRNGSSCALVGDFADYFAKENPRFDRTRFASAAGCGSNAGVRRRRKPARRPI